MVAPHGIVNIGGPPYELARKMSLPVDRTLKALSTQLIATMCSMVASHLRSRLNVSDIKYPMGYVHYLNGYIIFLHGALGELSEVLRQLSPWCSDAWILGGAP